MAWLKRNLFLVVGGVIALALLGLAGYYLYSQIGHYNEVTGDLSQTMDRLNSVYSANPFPNQDNIKAAKAEEQRARSYVQDVKKFFAAPPGTKLDISEFKSNLENSIVQLQREATNAGVNIATPQYKFTFAAQRPLAQIASNSLELLTGQLEDIKDLCAVLFRAKVHTLESLRRAAVSSDDPAPGADYLSRKITTNTTAGVVISPYELIFYGFSSDLAAVLDGLNHAPEFFAVKYLIVDQAPASATPPPPAAPMIINAATPTPAAEAPAAPSTGMSEMMRRRYGLGPRSFPGGPPLGAVPPTQAPTTPTPGTTVLPPKALQTVLDEKLLKFTLLVDAIKLKPGK